MNDMTRKMIETIKQNMFKCFNQLKEDDNVHDPNFSLRSLTPELALHFGFDYTIFSRFMAPIDTPIDKDVTNFRKRINLPISSLFASSSEITNPRDVMDDGLIKLDLPILFAKLYDFKEG